MSSQLVPGGVVHELPVGFDPASSGGPRQLVSEGVRFFASSALRFAADPPQGATAILDALAVHRQR